MSQISQTERTVVAARAGRSVRWANAGKA